MSIDERLSMCVPCIYWDAMWHDVGPTSLALTKLQTALTFLYELALTRPSHHCDQGDELFNMKLSFPSSCHFEF